MHVATLVPHDKRDDGEPVEVRVAEDLQAGIAAPALHRAPDQRLLAAADLGRADGLLQLEDETRPDRLHDPRRAALLAMLDLSQVVVLRRIDISDRAAARHPRHAVVEELSASGQHPRRAWAAYELVRRDENGVEVGLVWLLGGRIHPGVGIGGGGGEVSA